MSLKHTLLPIVVLLALLLAALACQSDNMRARDLPVWTCPTAVPSPTHTMPPTPFSGPGTPTPSPAATFTPWPTETPYQLTTDFPLARHVRIGGVGGVGLGIWVWMDAVSVDGPFDFSGEPRWVASWDVTVENASLTRDYEFYPFAQIYVLEVVGPDAASQRGAWSPGAEAHDLIDLPHLTLTDQATRLGPGEQTTIRAAALIPAPEVLRLAYVLDPLDTVDIAAMQDHNAIGGNIGVWITSYDDLCLTGEITPEYAGTQPAAVPLLARHPVPDPVIIARGFGCSDQYTGELGSACPASAPWFHNGVDYVAPAGTAYLDPLAGAGQVVAAGEDSTGPDCSAMSGSLAPHRGYGRYVRHSAQVGGHLVEVWGAHLSVISATVGDPTTPGGVLGEIGSSGCSTGSHLHLAVRVDGLYVDPLSLIP